MNSIERNYQYVLEHIISFNNSYYLTNSMDQSPS
jgi:hypothetical protein